jgi:NAD(P)-dependent dehydrogenase (short-subunit alcohol dehydrogenase family)
MATKDYTTTPEGIELQFGVNHIGHFLLTKLLIEKILAAKKGARIINLSSLGYITSPIRDDWNFKKEPYNCWRGYGQSKTANILFSSALARKLKGKGVLVFSVNPGCRSPHQ